MLCSFRIRIGLLSVAISGLLFAGFGIYAVMLLNRVGVERIDSELRALTDAHIRRLHPAEHWRRFDLSLHTIYGRDASKQFIIKATTPDNHVQYCSTNWPASIPKDVFPLSLTHAKETDLKEQDAHMPMLPSSRDMRPPRHGAQRHSRRDPMPMPASSIIIGPVYQTIGSEGEKWRAMTIANEGMVLSVAMSLDALHDEIDRFSRALIIAVPTALLIIIAGGWLIAHIALRPVKKISRTVETITANRLDQRIATGQADREFEHLVELINGMLERLERGFMQASRFSADAAHELKTPLAILQAQIEQSLQAAEDGSAEQADQASQLEEVQRLKAILSKLLLLSQADSGRLPISPASMNLTDLARAAAEDVGMFAPGVSVQLTLSGEVTINGDKDLINQAVSNLVSNAVKFGGPEGEIAIAVSLNQEGNAEFSVSNGGQPIPLEDQKDIFERFYRVDKARSRKVDGQGLGLSLVREIARAHGGDVVLVQSNAEGTVFCLILPQ